MLPAGFTVERPDRRDPWDILQAEGFVATNGFRTEGDRARIRAQGYTPAENSLHNLGDGVDLDHPGLSRAAQERRVRQLAAMHGWQNAEIINEGHHIHLGIPGWGAAPGTPGTANFGLPDLPDGFTLEQRGAINPDNFVQASAAAPDQPGTAVPAGPAPVPAELDERSFQHKLALIFANHELSPEQKIEAANALGAANGYPLDQETVRAAAERGTGAIAFEDPYREERHARLGVQGGISEHQPGFAEGIGNRVADASEALLGRYGAQRFGDRIEGLLDWTSVGDADAYNEFGAGRERAIAEGRYVDAAGNMLGQDVAAVSMIPIVGTTLKGIKRAGEAAVEGAQRLVGRGGRRQADGPPAGAQGAPAAPEGEGPPIVVTGREVDRIDVADLPPGFTIEEPLGRVHPLGEQPKPRDLADVARSIRPEDVTPIPANQVESLDEAHQANPGTLRDVEAPEPRRELEMRYFPHPSRPGEQVGFRGPLDAETFLRQRGGIQDQGGELSHIGLSNKPRPEAPGEHRLGRIVNPDGMTLDEAGEALFSAGYLDERPTTAEVVDILRSGRLGNAQRVFRPDDLEEMRRFEGAQEDRFRVDAAAQEGAPLADDVGEPITLRDLEANEPPATAYEHLPKVGGTVGNINLGNIETSGDIRRLLQNVETRFGGFDAARRGRITHAETEALASELGMTADDLLRRRRGQALNAEQALAARQLLAKSSDEVIDLARKATGPQASDESRSAFSEALLRHAAIHEQVAGATAEAGRALSAMRAAAKSRALSGRIHKAAIESMGGEGNLDKIADGILDLQRQGVGPGEINKFAEKATKPRFFDKILELWYNSILSGPATHVVNMVSNTLTSLSQIPEHAIAAGIGAGRRAINPKAAERIAFSEVGARATGLLAGTREGLREFARGLRTGEPSDFMSKLETRRHSAISGRKGDIVRIPGRFLTAEDELFKAMARRMDLHGQAVRIARREGLRGADARRRAAELAANPTDEMIQSAFDYGRYVTFQRPLGRFGQAAMNFTNMAPALKFVVPFIRTPTNLFKYAIERTPAAPIFKEVRDDIRAGGAQRDLAIARMMVGTGIAALVAQLAAEGAITGSGPADQGAMAMMRADGWQPYSIRIGDKYYSYQRLDPFASLLGVAADFASTTEHMTDKQRDSVASLMVGSVIQQIHSKTWLSGLSDVLLAIEDPDRFGEAWISRFAGSLAVPTAVAHLAGAIDPILREARSPIDRIKSRIPGVSQSLPARRDAWGQPIVREGGLGPDIASPIWQSTARNDPIIGELLNIGENLGRPSRHVTVEGEKRELSADEWGRYAELSGRYMRDDLSAAMADPEWRVLTPEEKRDWVKDMKRDARADARADLQLDMPPLPPGFELAQ